MEVDGLLIGLLLLNGYNFLNCVNNIKLCYVFSKFIRFYLGVIQQILNGEVHQITGVVLGLQVLL